jgi:hypothetical protein
VIEQGERMERRVIYTYYEVIGGHSFDNDRLLSSWLASWYLRGWEPRILTLTDAQKHGDYEKIMKRVSTLPTINNRQYEEACYRRWLAFDVVGGGVMCDTDVINFTAQVNDVPFPETVWIGNSSGVPCLVSASARGAKEIVDMINSSNEYIEINGLKHCSDMCMFMGSCFHRSAFAVEFGDSNFQSAPVIHFSFQSVLSETLGKLKKCEAVHSRRFLFPF